MAEQESLRWLLEPPGAGKAHVYVAIGEGAVLKPAVQEAIDKLLAVLQETDDDVQGFGCLFHISRTNPGALVENPDVTSSALPSAGIRSAGYIIGM